MHFDEIVTISILNGMNLCLTVSAINQSHLIVRDSVTITRLLNLSGVLMSTLATLKSLLAQRILIIDGAMGTMIQRHKLEEEDYRGERFADWASDLKGNNDLLVLTQPHIIQGIHEAYLDAGADIIETNSFNGTRVSMSDYHMEDLVPEINREAARLARAACDKYSTPEKPRFVAGVLGNISYLFNFAECQRSSIS